MLESVPDKELLNDFNSRALVPIKIEKKVYGVLTLESFRDNFFTEEDLLVLEAFSSQAAIALRNANLFNKLQMVTETFPGISELDTDMDKVLKKIADIAAEVLETDIFLLYRWDEDREKIIWPPIYAGDIKYLEYMMSEVDSSDTPIYFMKQGISHYSEDSQKDPIMTAKLKPPKDGVPARFVYREDIASSAGIILKVGQEKVGVMFIYYRIPHKFDEDERKIIENYASYIAIAIQNVRHFQEKENAINRAIQSERMAALGETAGFVAHNARSYLAAVRIYVNQLIKNISKKGITGFDEILEKMQKNLENVDSTIVDLLDISKKPELRKITISFKDAFKDKFKDFMNEAKSYDRRFSIKLAKDLPPLFIDVKKISQVFTNLFNNSIEAASIGGKIRVEAKTSNGKFVIYWENSGKEIPVEMHERIFDVFFSKKGSWGLGLAYCKRIIEGHNGKIYVDTEFKKGSRFIIELPF